MKSTAWTAKEDTIIKKFYTKIPTLEIKKLLLRHRSVQALRCRARILGIKKNTALLWTPEEDCVIRKNYSSGCIKKVYMLLFRKRSVAAIRRRANQLNIFTERIWTKDCDLILTRHYLKNGLRGAMVAFPNKSKCSIEHRLSRLKLLGSSFPDWTPKEDAILKKWYSKKGLVFVKKMLPRIRTRKAIGHRVGKLKLSFRTYVNRIWTLKEDSVLKKWFCEKGLYFVKKLMPHRSLQSISHRASKHGLCTYPTVFIYLSHCLGHDVNGVSVLKKLKVCEEV